MEILENSAMAMDIICSFLGVCCMLISFGVKDYSEKTWLMVWAVLLIMQSKF